MQPTYLSAENKLSSLGEKIFLDRYSLKDGSKDTLKEGDTVVVLLDPKSSQREIGEIVAIDGVNLSLVLRDGTPFETVKERVDKPLELHVEDMMDRVAAGTSQVEKDQDRQTWEKNFRWLLEGWKFVPGGRILSSCGSSQQLTFYNCFVVPSPHDSRDGIINTLSHMAEIMSRGGGVGINLSTLRPRHSYVKGVNGRSSGSVSWGGLYSFVTGLIEQGGSRRGALMLILNVWHPDILEFINSKREEGKITNANISVGITDDFMQAVHNDSEWSFIFPDTNDPLYASEWKGDIKDWQQKGGTVIVHKTVKARDIWNNIIESAWASAEPGIWFVDRSNELSNSWYYPEGLIVCTNPCGEQPLPAWSVCNLGHINLSKMSHNGQVDWDKLRKTVQYAVRFLDNIIDTTPYFFNQNKEQQLKERRIGLGTVGLAELLIRQKVRYGSPESEQFISQLYQFIAETAYQASADLASEKGSFAHFESDKYLQGKFVERLSETTKTKIASQGIRNVTLLTQAPTGTVGTMVGTSTGIEPFYFWSYTRKSRLGIHIEKVAVLDEWQQQHPDEPTPDYFVSALDLTPQEHVKVQAAIQYWVDSAISKTCNVPSNYTVDQVRELYELMYKLGCKGGTIYRDKSRDEQVLNADKTEKSVKSAQKASENKNATKQPKVRPRPTMRRGVTVTKSTPTGTAHIIMNDDEDNQPFEVFIEIGKGGSDIKAMAEALGRIASILLRVNSPLSPKERVKEIVKQLGGIGGQSSVGFGKNRVRSLPDAISQALSENYLASDDNPELEKIRQKAEAIGKITADLCPECGNSSFINIEGCTKCYLCGHSEC
ncbi:MAG: adenosylcobalamin-dependent ribonucleoside-diphosphate reductase [Candidatus Bruticola sp.]